MKEWLNHQKWEWTFGCFLKQKHTTGWKGGCVHGRVGGWVGLEKGKNKIPEGKLNETQTDRKTEGQITQNKMLANITTDKVSAIIETKNKEK